MKIFTLAPHEDWICDRFVNEWNSYHQNLTAKNPQSSDVIWILADWCWRRIDPNSLAKKKVVCTVHHIVPDKFGESAKNEFMTRDQFVDVYHVPCELTKKQIQSYTNKPINSFPFWANQNIWYPKSDKEELREKYGIKNKDAFIIGSMQRDTEGHDLKSPKLEKGPDLFCDYVEALHKQDPSVEVLLAAWRRQYVMERLKRAGIKFYYFELPSFDVINDLYNLTNLYLCSSRFEGGPQSVIEASATRTPIISSTVGIAPELLHDDCLIDKGATIRKASSDKVIDYNYAQVEKIFMPRGFERFERMLDITK